MRGTMAAADRSPSGFPLSSVALVVAVLVVLILLVAEASFREAAGFIGLANPILTVWFIHGHAAKKGLLRPRRRGGRAGGTVPNAGNARPLVFGLGVSFTAQVAASFFIIASDPISSMAGGLLLWSILVLPIAGPIIWMARRQLSPVG